MKSSILFKVGLILLVIFLIAPFTFLKPTVIDKTFEPVPSTIVAKAEQKLIPEKKPKKTVKRKTEKPLHNVLLPNFSLIRDIKAKKKAFFNFIKPVVVKHNKKLLQTRAKIDIWIEKISLDLPLTEQEHQQLNHLADRYKVDLNASTLTKLNALLVRVDVIPMPLVLVQAANESAWGTSRFSRIGLNFFGIWCFQQGCGMVPNGRGEGEVHEVAAFQSLEEAVTRYYENINTNEAYRVFRTIRAELRSQDQKLNPAILATGLLPYSERGIDYVNDITSMLRHNKQYFL